jgi:hypothetical protein
VRWSRRQRARDSLGGPLAAAVAAFAVAAIVAVACVQKLKPCVDGACASGSTCMYLTSGGCTASGVCIPRSEFGSSACGGTPAVLCGCDGGTVSVDCNWPGGFSAVPVASETCGDGGLNDANVEADGPD